MDPKIPVVSIITITYNHEKFIRQCIESIVSQTFRDWELVIMDDGSTDKTGEIIKTFSDPRITYHRQENRGISRLSETYNEALASTRGQFIAILEGDDFWPPGKLEHQVRNFPGEAALSWGRFFRVNDLGEEISTGPRGWEKFQQQTRKEMIASLLKGDFIQPVTVLIRKTDLIDIGGFFQPSYAPFADYCTWLRLAARGPFHMMNEILGYWRIHGAQISRIQSHEMDLAARKIAFDFFRSLPPDEQASIPVTEREILNSHTNRVARTDFTRGRIALVKGEYPLARRLFVSAWKDKRYTRKICAAAGILFSLFRLDMEWAAGILGIPRISRSTFGWVGGARPSTNPLFRHFRGLVRKYLIDLE